MYRCIREYTHVFLYSVRHRPPRIYFVSPLSPAAGRKLSRRPRKPAVMCITQRMRVQPLWSRTNQLSALGRLRCLVRTPLTATLVFRPARWAQPPTGSPPSPALHPLRSILSPPPMVALGRRFSPLDPIELGDMAERRERLNDGRFPAGCLACDTFVDRPFVTGNAAPRGSGAGGSPRLLSLSQPIRWSVCAFVRVWPAGHRRPSLCAKVISSEERVRRTRSRRDGKNGGGLTGRRKRTVRGSLETEKTAPEFRPQNDGGVSVGQNDAANGQGAGARPIGKQVRFVVWRFPFFCGRRASSGCVDSQPAALFASLCPGDWPTLGDRQWPTASAGPLTRRPQKVRHGLTPGRGVNAERDKLQHKSLHV